MKSLARAVTTLTIISVVAIVTGYFIWISKTSGRHERSEVVKGGPFDLKFGEGLYPSKSEEIESWIRDRIPEGTPRDQVRSILSDSFSVDLSSGNKMYVDKLEIFLSGSQSTAIRLIFNDENCFIDVMVEQDCTWL